MIIVWAFALEVMYARRKDGRKEGCLKHTYLLSLGCKDARPKKRSTSRQFAIQGFSRQRAQAQSWGRGEHQARHLAVLRVPMKWTLRKSPVLCRLALGLIIIELRAGQTCTYVPGSHTRVLWIGAGPPETSILLFSHYSLSRQTHLILRPSQNSSMAFS